MDFLIIFIAFCGGVFGAMLGALGAFVFCGILGLVGVAYTVSAGSFDWIGVIAFGGVFGPYTSFAGGVAAAGYAKKRGYIDNGRDIVMGLMSLEKLDVLLVGGVFAVLGALVAHLMGVWMPGIIDAGAGGVVVSALVAKLLFTGKLISKSEKKEIRYGPQAPAMWIPYMRRISQQTILAISVGGLSSYITLLMLQDERAVGIAPFVGFFISATSLILLYHTAIPVTHHITVCAAYGVVASDGNLVWGIAGAVLTALIAEVASKIFLSYGQVHVDPPAVAILVTSLFLLGIFPLIGIYKLVIVAYIIIGIAIVYSLVEEISLLREESLKELKE